MMDAKDVKMAIDNLSCPVCYQLFKKPKYLPCHHSYCEQCLEMLQKQSKITCPECRKESFVPPGGVRDLDDNFFITRIVDELILNRKVEGEEEVKCDECSGEDPVVTFCPDCTTFLCHVCNEHHKRSNKFRDHGIIPLSELRSKKNISIQPNPKAMMCREHELELSFYCATCDQLVCMYCTVKDHNGHNHDTVKKTVDKHRQELKKITAPVEEMMKGLSETHDNIEKQRKKMVQQVNEVKCEIDQHFAKAIQKLINEKKKLKQELYDIGSEKEIAFTIQLSEIETVQTEVLRMKTLKDEVEKGFDQEVLSVKKEITHRMQQITDKYKKVNAPPAQQLTIRFIPTPTEATVPQIGKLEVTDTPKCTDQMVNKLLKTQVATEVSKVQLADTTRVTSIYETEMRTSSSTDTTSHNKETSTSNVQLATPSTTGVTYIWHDCIPPEKYSAFNISTTHEIRLTPTPASVATSVGAIRSTNLLTTKATPKLASNTTAGVSTPSTANMSGKKRRRRCSECEGCKAPKCGTCKNCVEQTPKKQCIMKKCRQLK